MIADKVTSPEGGAVEGLGDYTMVLTEPQAFEKFPALASHIERMAVGRSVGSLIEWDAFLRELNAALAPAETTDCKRCAGNGEIVTDWDEYLSPPKGAPADHATTDCPDCDGIGKVEAPAEAGEALYRLVAFIRAEKPLTPARAEELGRLLDEADRAALTPKGSGVSQADLAALERAIGVEYYAGSDDLGDSLKRILTALRAQPQAREEEGGTLDPAFVAWLKERDCLPNDDDGTIEWADIVCTLNDWEVDLTQAREDANPVAWTGSGSIDALKAGVEGHMWPTKAAAHPVPLYTHPATDALRIAVAKLEKAKITDDPAEVFMLAMEALAALQAEQKGAKS